MKIQVLHDKAGNILGIFAPADGNTRKGGIESRTSDTTVTETDAPSVTLPTDVNQSDRAAATLAYLTEHYEIQSGRIVKRKGKSTGNS